MSEQEHGRHIVQPKTYAIILLALFFLTGITVSVAFLNLGPFNDLIAMTVACTKTLLVVLFFMHLRYSPKLTQLVAGAAFLWFAILVVLLLADFWSRNWIPAPQGW